MLIAKELLLDKNNDIISSKLIDLLLRIRFNGGYDFGHIKFVKKFIVFLEDVLTNKGQKSSKLSRIIHWATGNSTYYLDYVNGSDANDGSTWALAWKTITSGATAARVGGGDIIRIAKSPDPTSVGNADWTDQGSTVVLDTAVNATVDLCESGWTASANITATASTDYVKQGTYGAKIVVGSSFTTGMLAYRNLGGALNLSGYQQLSFWIRASSTTFNGKGMTLNLCSDTAGTTVVDSFAIPDLLYAGRWHCITVNKGSALGSNINSISLTCTSDPTTPTIYLDNIIACKAVGSADSLSLTSLISKNSLAHGGEEGWYAIKSIVGDTITLDRDPTAEVANIGKYYGTTENVATYKRETIKTVFASSTTAKVQEIQDSGGSMANRLAFQGGYDTSSSEQNGETFFDGTNGGGYGIYSASGKYYITLDRISATRYYSNFYLDTPVGFKIDVQDSSNSASRGFYITNGYDLDIGVIGNVNNTGDGGLAITMINSTLDSIYNMNYNYSNYTQITAQKGSVVGTIKNVKGNLSTTVGLYIILRNSSIGTIEDVAYNTGHGVMIGADSDSRIDEITLSHDNTKNGVIFNNTPSGGTVGFLETKNNTLGGMATYGTFANIETAIINEATEFVELATTLFYDEYGDRIYSLNHDDTAGNLVVFLMGGRIYHQATTRHTASGKAWQITTTRGIRNATFPINMRIAKVACNANAEVTVSAYVKKDHATDVGARIVCKGKQIAGVTTDVADVKANDTDWEQLSISFTPTVAGVVEIIFEGYFVAGNSSVYIDDITISQA